MLKKLAERTALKAVVSPVVSLLIASRTEKY